ncbi:Acetylcholine receptor subunit alpha-type acr-16 [Mizuhopecten yessoensis]|uniref:Acetylcholine receptor subunit alpha-type acr-16 n=1 Tax=Mizuhopecten yessoensis TaxID=6573 RepID=A0A210PFM1_MIZYE|nr:Acetylcholine receptor subunit alpha-type acr-16 [Mizuhopecten yessoensis]
MRSISEINERLQTMSFIAWLDIGWVDEFLILSDNVESLLIPKEDIWYPEISIYEAVDDHQTISDGKYVILFRNGHVSWYPGGEYIIRCVIDIRRYPFDVQVCNLRVGAWITTTWTQRLIASEKGLDVSKCIENGDYQNNGRTNQNSWLQQFYNMVPYLPKTAPFTSAHQHTCSRCHVVFPKYTSVPTSNEVG